MAIVMAMVMIIVMIMVMIDNSWLLLACFGFASLEFVQ